MIGVAYILRPCVERGVEVFRLDTYKGIRGKGASACCCCVAVKGGIWGAGLLLGVLVNVRVCGPRWWHAMIMVRQTVPPRACARRLSVLVHVVRRVRGGRLCTLRLVC